MSFDISTKRGDTWQGAQFTISLNSVALDLTGAAIVMQLRKTASDTEVILQFSSSAGSIVITNPTGGAFAINPVIIDVAPRVYDYDVEITLSDGRVITPITGLFEIVKDVTRA